MWEGNIPVMSVCIYADNYFWTHYPRNLIFLSRRSLSYLGHDVWKFMAFGQFQKPVLFGRFQGFLNRWPTIDVKVTLYYKLDQNHAKVI